MADPSVLSVGSVQFTVAVPAEGGVVTAMAKAGKAAVVLPSLTLIETPE